jgi:two-component system sensor histidine kinase KdpD
MHDHGTAMTSRALSPSVLNAERPSRAAGVIVAAGGGAAATAVIYPLKHVAPVVSLGVVYMLPVVVMSTFWGLAFGVATSVLSAASFNFFQLPPGGTFSLADGRNWVALVAFVAVAVPTSWVAELARARAGEGDQRRREADLAAELAQLLLGTAQLDDALELAAQRLAAAVGASSAAIELGKPHRADRSQLAFALRSDEDVIATLLLSGALSEAERARVAERVVPPLESILAAAVHRAELQAEVVETAALRRSDEMKTAVLRSVSHDLRTPVTAILTAASAWDPRRPTSESVAEVRELVLEAGTRLWRLIEKLLDLSLLQAGRMEPRLVWYSVDEVLQEAIEQTDADQAGFRLTTDAALPLLRGDPGQLERAFGNLLENAARYSGGKPVLVRARAVGDRVWVRVVDQGPGIPPSEQERIFLPFYRASRAQEHDRGSGLGLTIAKGFVELNGGRISVESVPGQGTSFVVELAVGERELEPVPAGASPQRVGG